VLLGLLTSAPALAVLPFPSGVRTEETPAATSVVVQPGHRVSRADATAPPPRPIVPHLSQADVAFMEGMIMHHSRPSR